MDYGINHGYLPAHPHEPSQDAEAWGRQVAEFDGNTYTKYRGDTGEPEQWIKTSVTRLGHMVKKAVDAARAQGEKGGA